MKIRRETSGLTFAHLPRGAVFEWAHDYPGKGPLMKTTELDGVLVLKTGHFTVWCEDEHTPEHNYPGDCEVIYYPDAEITLGPPRL